MKRPRTLGELKASGWPLEHLRRGVREEARANLAAKLRTGAPLFPGVYGYDETVIPALVRAILARQHFILLGLRGQAKTRILRSLVRLLDSELPALDTPLRDHPLSPVSPEGRRLLAEAGDDAPLVWLAPEDRYVEKLATPDVTVADLIGELDPIKAARRGEGLSDLEAVHYGLIPRANRGVFAINELPDLPARVQVALFNVLEEGDVQVRGFPLRLPLDVWLVFSANPEDYTARGRIVTPLKDRIDAEIRTHYPRHLAAGMRITRAEARLPEGVRIPDFVARAVERVAFLARRDPRVDPSSGVSQRLAIALLEQVAAGAEARALIHGEAPLARPRDVYGGLPAITGKLELEYEGELVGAEALARELIARAFAEEWGERPGLEAVTAWFEEGRSLELPDAAETAWAHVREVAPLADLAAPHAPSAAEGVAWAEFALEALVGRGALTRTEAGYRKSPSPEEAAGGRETLPP
ncbi:sigma 54-interacting transcriptional regulator [Deinococcota bacterium DY0809b]